MKDERFKKIMSDLGMPNSRSLLVALRQVENEAHQEMLLEIKKERGKMKINIEILEHGKGLEIPKKESKHSACVDLRAAVADHITIQPRTAVLIPTGFKMEVPVGFEAQVRPRSGLALKKQITVLNTPGTIDSDYRGEVGVILFNHSQLDFVVMRGDRVAQMCIKKVEDFELESVEELSNTERGEGGFNSTGVK